MLFVYVYIFLFLPSIFMDFLAEFIAGFLGILIGFSLDRYIDLWKKAKISKQVKNHLFVELNNNLDLVKEIKPIFEPEKIPYFILFQTNAWNIFSSRLESDNIEILFDLASIYHEFQLFNEGMKNEGTGGGISSILERKPNFLEQLQKDLESIIDRLGSLKV